MRQSIFALVPIVGFSFLSSQVMAASALESIEVNSQVEGVEDRLNRTGKLKDDVIQTEVVSKKAMANKQAGSVNEAIRNEPGVRVSTECSICGVKRVTLNGLKGEHTTLMIDGVPNSSMLEGFYGYDAIPTAGIENIEISRGAGAALIASEAIGGVINVVTEKPRENGVEIDLSQGTSGYRKYQMVGKKISKDGRTRAIIAGQTDNIDQYDQDNNDINEAPQLENRSIMAKIWHDVTPRDTITFRIADQASEVFGGPMIGGNLANSKSDAVSQNPGSAPGFLGGDVGNKPDPSTSTARDWLETIRTTKQEYTSKWIHEINQDWNTAVTGSYVKSHMDAIYEGITYKADQEIYFIDTKVNHFASDEHFLTFGVDYKLDTSKTEGTSWDGTNNKWLEKSPNDSFRNSNLGLYLRDIWTPSNALEISAALRVDKIDVEFTDQDRKFDETKIAPRLHIRYDHNFSLTSRLALGRGYRVPLQFFESEHGIIDQGFAVDVDKLETSNSARYTLSFTGAKTDLTASISATEVNNLAMLEDRNGVPTLISSDFTSMVSHADVSGSYNFGPHNHWTASGSVEMFQYDKNYRETFGVLPIEQRVRLGLDYEGHNWFGNISGTWIGSRNYSDYSSLGYNEHYDKENQQGERRSKSPSYYTIDTKVSKQFEQDITVYAGVNNMLNYTQTSAGDSPYFYNENNEWDVVHIWGPLRGRVIYAGVTIGL